MDYDYTVEIEYIAKESIPVKALSKQWAEIVAKEKWVEERSEDIVSIEVEEKHGEGKPYRSSFRRERSRSY